MRWSIPRLILSLLPLLASAAEPAGRGPPVPSPGLLTGLWSAQWITHPAAPKSGYGVYLFRKQLTLPRAPGQFVVHVTADARYRLLVNGRSVCFGPQRGDNLIWHYDSVDLAPWLHAGANVIAARVWNYGDEGPFAIMSLRTGFLLQGDTAAERGADTNGSWKVLRDDAYQPIPLDRERLKTFIVVGPGDRVDGALHPWGWETADDNDQRWSAPRLLGKGMPEGWGADIGGWLRPRSIPFMEETPLRLARVRRASGIVPGAGFVEGRTPLPVPARTRATVLLDQGYETSAFPQLTVSGGKGGRVTLTYAEALFDPEGHKGNRDETDHRELVGVGDEFHPDGGAHRRFAPLDFRTYRYLQLEIETGDEPLVVEDLHGIFTAYPFQERGSFASDDPSLERIWRAGWRTARL